MNTTTTAPRPFASPEEFFAECGLHEIFGQWAAKVRRRSAMSSAGFRLDRYEHIPEHRIGVLAGSRPLAEEPRTTRRIRRAVVRSFQREGLVVRSDMVAVYWGQTRVRVHLGILEPEA